MKSTIGVVIATYNGGQFVEKQLESIIQQTITPDMIVISDANSTDDTVGKCRRTLEASTIKYKIIQNNRQLSVQENFNMGLDACDNDYIFLADQDDYWDTKKIEIITESMAKYQACLAFTNAQITDENLMGQGRTLWESIGYHQKEQYTIYERFDSQYIQELMRHNIATGMTMCLTRELKHYVMPLSTRDIHDKWIALLAIHFGKVVAIDRELVLYRQHANNTIGTKKNIAKSIKNQSSYKQKLINLYMLYTEAAEKLQSQEGYQPDQMSGFIHHLQNRIDYIEKKKHFFYAVFHFKRYKQYEYKAREILCKDIVTRLMTSLERNK